MYEAIIPALARQRDRTNPFLIGIRGDYANSLIARRRKEDGAAAVAVLEGGGLRCRAEGPNGAVLVTDMPRPVGGTASAPTPGWMLRAALANCDATVIAMRAD